MARNGGGGGGESCTNKSVRKERRMMMMMTESESLDIVDLNLVDKFDQLTFMEGNEIVQTTTDDKNADELLPKNVLYYGWFFTNQVSLIIKSVADSYLLECLSKVPQFQRFLLDACALHDCKDPETFYRHPRVKSKNKKILDDEFKYHITAKYLAREPHLDYSKLAQNFVGRTFSIELSGLFFTDKTFGIRIQLNQSQKLLFDEREGSDIPLMNSEIPGHFLKSKRSTKIALPSSPLPSRSSSSAEDAIKLLETELENDAYELAKKFKTNNTVNSKSKNCPSSLLHNNAPPGIHFLSAKKEIDNDNTSRAHITIGTARKVSPVQTGIDLLEIIDLERRAKKDKDSASSSNLFVCDYPVEGGILRQFGRKGDAFVMYPCHNIVVDGIFNYFI